MFPLYPLTFVCGFLALANVVAAVGLSPHRTWHKFTYPTVYLNVCAISLGSPVGIDGSVLIRRFGDPDAAVTRFCKFHRISPGVCQGYRELVHARMSAFVDEYNWIMAPDSSSQSGAVSVSCAAESGGFKTRSNYSLDFLQIAEAVAVGLQSSAGHFALFMARNQEAPLTCYRRFCAAGNVPEDVCHRSFGTDAALVAAGMVKHAETTADNTTTTGVVHQLPHPPPSSHPFDVPHYCFMPISSCPPHLTTTLCLTTDHRHSDDMFS
jgi:hypothetical protein